MSNILQYGEIFHLKYFRLYYYPTYRVTKTIFIEFV